MVFFNPRIIHWLLKKSGVDQTNFQYRKLAAWVGGYVLVRLLAGGLAFCDGNAIYTIPIQSLPYIIGSWTLVGVLSSLLFFSPSNLGFNEVTFSLLLSNILPSPIAVIIALLLRSMAAQTLRHAGFAVDECSSGEEALAALRDAPYDLVLMDVQMPEMDGFEATARIRAPGSGVLRPDVPIVAMTAHALPADRERCLAAGMDDHLPKPYTRDQLTSAMVRWLPKHLVEVKR